MEYPIRISNGLKFQVTKEFKMNWEKWVDGENGKKKILTSVSRLDGYKKVFLFDMPNGKQLKMSRDQVSQMLVSALEEKEHWTKLNFIAKDNGKEGMEKRWFINVAKDNEEESVEEMVEAI